MADNWIDIRLPRWRQLGRFVLWGVGRLTFSGSLFVLDASTHTLTTGITLLKWTRGALCNLLKVYDQLPYAGTYGANIIETTAVTLTEPENIITELLQVLEGKHALIIGDTGAGKSLIAQWLAYQVGGEVTVYDPDASPEEWVGLNVIGRRGDFGAIQQSMLSDMQELERRIDIRGQKGDRALVGMDAIKIAEEFPLLKDEVPVAADWMVTHARRGRKPKLFIILLSQDDNVKTLGIEGEGSVRKCFRMVRLGKFAVTHAKTLKDSALVEWLKSGKYRCMVDDQPCQLPDLSSFKMVTPRLSASPQNIPLVTPEPTAIQDFQPEITTSPEVLLAVKVCLREGISESKIIKEVLGYQGSQYQQGKAILKKLRGES